MVMMDADEEATGDAENIEELVVTAEESINDEVEMDGSETVEVLDEEKERRGDVKDDLVREIISGIEFLDQINEFRRTQQKECFNLVRRLKILVPFVEEIKGFESPSLESCRHFLYRLRKVILSARKLLETCNNGSKIFLVKNIF